jgi:hypothetical protein
MGAAGLCQVPSGAVCGTFRRWLTWENWAEQQSGRAPYSVRIEGSGVQIPSALRKNRRSEACIDVSVITAKSA